MAKPKARFLSIFFSITKFASQFGEECTLNMRFLVKFTLFKETKAKEEKAGSASITLVAAVERKTWEFSVVYITKKAKANQW